MFRCIDPAVGSSPCPLRVTFLLETLAPPPPSPPGLRETESNRAAEHHRGRTKDAAGIDAGRGMIRSGAFERLIFLIFILILILFGFLLPRSSVAFPVPAA